MKEARVSEAGGRGDTLESGFDYTSNPPLFQP